MREDIVNIIRTKYPKDSGIVYCFSQMDTEKMAEYLVGEGIKAGAYHAGMEASKRMEMQRRWSSGEIPIMCATIAFGMGINRATVRFVIHASIPQSIEGYFQETGRAGRDGLSAECILFYCFGDKNRLTKMIDANVDASREYKEQLKANLKQMVQYCENKVTCRRFLLLKYFNQPFDPLSCAKTCDNCKSNVTFQNVDFSNHAKNIINLGNFFSSFCYFF